MGKVFLRGSQVGQVAGMFGIVLSVTLGSIALALPIVVGGVLFVGLALFLMVVMPETGFKPTPRGERSYWQAMISPARDGLRLVRVRPILLTFLAIALVGGLYSEGFDRLWQVHLLRDFALPPLGTFNAVVWFGIIGIVGVIPSTLLIEIVRRRLNLKSQKTITRVLIVGYAARGRGAADLRAGGGFLVRADRAVGGWRDPQHDRPDPDDVDEPAHRF